MKDEATRPLVAVAAAFAAGVLASLLVERYLRRVQGIVPTRRAEAFGRGSEQDDAELRERVRSGLGDWVSHPGAIGVDVEDGVVRVSGEVLAQEIDGLLLRLTRVPGVRKVRNALSALGDPSGFGEVPRPRTQPVH